jgi:hypothetical protein
MPVRTAIAITSLMAATALANSQFTGSLQHLKPPEPISETDCDVKVCGDVRLVSCHPEVDGPVTYWDTKHNLLLSSCGLSGCSGDFQGVQEFWGACEATGTVKVLQAVAPR